jgi:MoaA/NifB/PqqE/SkfB family radical SAM enzyme
MTPILFPITYKCNLSCKYCKIRDSKKEPDMPKCLSLIKGSKNEWVFITGGEPMLVDCLLEVCSTIRSFGKKIGITTNGTIHNYEILKHVNRIGVSIDGGRDITDANRGLGTFDSAMSFLENCVGKVETAILATTDNDSEVSEIADMVGVDYLQVTRAI